MVTCTCGNKYFSVLQQLENSDAVIDAVEGEPTAVCPGCGAVWQYDGSSWQKVSMSSTTLHGLRMISNPGSVGRGAVIVRSPASGK